MDKSKNSTMDHYASPEDYFSKRKDYIEFYYLQDAETRSIRLKCLEIAASKIPNGATSEKLLEYSNAFYNWIFNYGKETERKP